MSSSSGISWALLNLIVYKNDGCSLIWDLPEVILSRLTSWTWSIGLHLKFLFSTNITHQKVSAAFDNFVCVMKPYLQCSFNKTGELLHFHVNHWIIGITNLDRLFLKQIKAQEYVLAVSPCQIIQWSYYDLHLHTHLGPRFGGGVAHVQALLAMHRHHISLACLPNDDTCITVQSYLVPILCSFWQRKVWHPPSAIWWAPSGILEKLCWSSSQTSWTSPV